MTPSDRQYILANLAKTDAEIAAEIAALPPLTVSPIMLADLGPVLRTSGMMSIIKGVVANADTPADVRAGLTDFLDQLADLRVDKIQTATNPTIAARAAAVLNGLAPVATNAGLDAAALIAEVYALGGGLRYSQPTEAEVAAVRAQAARETETSTLAIDSQRAMERLMHWRDAYIGGTCPTAPPAAQVVEAPQGFAFDEITGRLVAQ